MNEQKTFGGRFGLRRLHAVLRVLDPEGRATHAMGEALPANSVKWEAAETSAGGSRG